MKVTTDVVEPNIPLLLSRNSMKKASMVLDFLSDSAIIFRNQINLNITVSGHYTIPIYHAPTDRRVYATLLAHDGSDAKKVADKLHRQFAHPTSDKLRKLLNDSGRKDSALHGAVEEVTNSCETCLRYRQPHPRPAVSMPMASVFNETMSADLKIWKSSYFLVLVDMCTK